MSRPTLAEMEIAYERKILRAKENWPPSSLTITELREQEFLIDSERSQLGLPLRFHTAEQLAILLEPDYENQTDEGAYYARCSLLERHYMPTSAAETLRYRFTNPGEMSMDPHSDELNVIESLWGSRRPAMRDLPEVLPMPLLAAASGDQVASGPTSGLGPVPAHAVRAPVMKVTVGGCETLTIDGLIAALRDLRALQGGDAPVWRDITDGSGLVLVTQPITAAETDGGAAKGVVLV